MGSYGRNEVAITHLDLSKKTSLAYTRFGCTCKKFSAAQTPSPNYSPHKEKTSHTCKPRSKRRSERAPDRREPLTWLVLCQKLAFFFLVPRFTSLIGRLPQGTGPLPAIEEAYSSVAFRRE